MASNNSGSRSTGSPESGGPAVFLQVGFLRRAHGVRGEMVMEILTDFPERLIRGRTLLIGEKHKPMKIESVRPHKEGCLIHFAGMNTPEEASLYRNQEVYSQTSDMAVLPEGQYYHHQVMGLRVYQDDRFLGIVEEILVTGANDVYVVQNEEGEETLIPAVAECILDVDLINGKMTVKLPDWG